MAPGSDIFKKSAVPFYMSLHGNVNGKEFRILGEGEGDARIGNIKGKWVLSHPEDGKCPMSWAVLAPTFAYGFKVYAHYPEDFVQYWQERMPEGYSQRRITTFARLSGKDDLQEEGTMNTVHEIQMRERMVEGQITWIVDSRITLEATINEDSPLLLSGGLDIYLSNIERTLAFGEDALKNYCQFFYPIKSASMSDYMIATQMTHHRPRSISRGSVQVPPPHHKRTDCKQWKDENEERDHVMQDEISALLPLNQEGPWATIGK